MNAPAWIATVDQVIAGLRELHAEQVAHWGVEGFLPRKTARLIDWCVRKRAYPRYAAGLALPYLVKVCELCGRKALYRYGAMGRCREHRMVKPEGILRLEDRLDRRRAAIGQRVRAADAKALRLRATQGLGPEAQTTIGLSRGR